MSDFSAKIIAQLDTSKIPSQLAKIQSIISKQKFVITVDTSATKNINQVTIYFDIIIMNFLKYILHIMGESLHFRKSHGTCHFS